MSIATVKITTLSPVHIGSGQDLHYNFQYLYFQGKITGTVAVVDEAKIFDVIGEENISQWVTTIDKGEDLLQWLKTRQPNLQPADISKRTAGVPHAVPRQENAIKEHIHLTHEQRPTIPGSSLKGAIRTAVFNKLILDNPGFARNKNNLGYQNRRGQFMYKDSQLQAHYIAKKEKRNYQDEIQYNANEDFLKLLRISDAVFPNTGIYKSETVNLFRNGWGIKERDSSFWECLSAGQDTKIRIQTPDDLLEQIKERNYISDNLELLDLPRLFQLINTHTLRLTEYELDYWDREGIPLAIGDYFDQLEEIEAQIKKIQNSGTTECILRVGAGGGWTAMTGGWAANPDILSDADWKSLKEALRRKYYPDGIAFPKTRRLLEGGVGLGYVKLEAE